MVIPSFSSFAPTPDIAGSFLSARRLSEESARSSAQLQLEQQKLELSARNSAQEMALEAARMSAGAQLEQQKLQQQAVQANMEFEAKMKAEQESNLRAQTEFQIEQAYKQAQLGLRQREVEAAEKASQLKAMEAARQFQAEQLFEARFRELGGTDDAARKAVFEAGPSIGSSIFSSAMRGDGASIPDLPGVGGIGSVTPVPGREDLLVGRTGPNSATFIPVSRASLPDSMAATPIEGAPGMVQIGNRAVRLPESRQEKVDMSELKALQAEHLKDLPGKMASRKRESGEKLSDVQSGFADEYENRARQIARLKASLGITSQASAALPSTMSTNRIGRFTIIED